MRFQASSYRKNFFLNITFIVLVLLSLLAALSIAYNLTKDQVRSEFEAKKIDVLEETVRPYNDFFQNTLPEVSFYQGYLDSTSAAKFAYTVLREYKFISSIVFYDTQISNRPSPIAFRSHNLYISPVSIYQFKRDSTNFTLIYHRRNEGPISLRYLEEFNKVAGKLAAHVEVTDSVKAMAGEEFANVFYNITQNRVTYMNIPREEDLKVFKQLMFDPSERPVVFEQDVLSFKLNAYEFRVVNSHPQLYQFVTIKPIVYEAVGEGDRYVTTEIPLSGAFADYKLYFRSTEEHLLSRVNSKFLPVALIILVVYLVLGFIGYLIYRNLYINNRLFKLQYDFLNNLTHEFKTPVSVIKIAGNNIRSAKELSERERLHYGKILDEEADKLNDLMNKLLSFTQIENQSIQIKKEEINLDVFVQNLVDAYQIKYPEFEIKYDIRNVERFNSDPVLLTSIFQNLIDNAYKYSMPKRKILDISISLERGNIIFRFADQGIGIPKEEMNNIFQKFYRIQSQYNQQGSVGLGLAFCKELVNFMNGQISVKSKVGVGSEFTIILPYND
ncbi:sensor histidine kinase KdpD [Pedobacter sp. SYSU D00535]|uniref:sensor histidine kinase n=1 Tax=Pedobacter sp. SYSU D00535 TaxID=2810308 RepID=UPI001A97254C|nr:HAMP domain-containing sensor histidine kinase [Pedobacter sp. SYSU D00535]